MSANEGFCRYRAINSFTGRFMKNSTGGTAGVPPQQEAGVEAGAVVMWGL